FCGCGPLMPAPPPGAGPPLDIAHSHHVYSVSVFMYSTMNSHPPSGGGGGGGHVLPFGHKPLVSVRLSGLPSTYAYRFQLCGSVGSTTATPAGSGETHRPASEYSRVCESYSPSEKLSPSPV